MIHHCLLVSASHFSASIIYISSPVLVFLALILLAITLCLKKYKCHWFLIEPGSANPYKLLHKVLKFAKDHTNPFVVVPSPTVRMSFPPGLTWERRNMEDPSQLNRLRM